MGTWPTADGGGARVTLKAKDTKKASQDKHKAHKKPSSRKTENKNVKSTSKMEETKEKASSHKGKGDKGRIHAHRTGDNSVVFTF